MAECGLACSALVLPDTPVFYSGTPAPTANETRRARFAQPEATELPSANTTTTVAKCPICVHT